MEQDADSFDWLDEEYLRRSAEMSADRDIAEATVIAEAAADYIIRAAKLGGYA